MARERLDKLLVDRGLVASRERARALVMTGAVLVRGQPETKPGTLLDPNVEITLREADHPYVSRGALKLVKGLDTFGIDPTGKVALDIGASTGGFTDVLLRRGATRVYAIDVGYGQLAWSLRQDPRVITLERTNVRNMDLALVPEECDLAVVDVSFISLTLVLPRIAELLAGGPRVASATGAAAGTASATISGDASGISSATSSGDVTDIASSTSSGASGISSATSSGDATDIASSTSSRDATDIASSTRPTAGKPIICLVKPQFEVGREQVGKGGVVRDEAARRSAVTKIRDWANANGFIAGEDVESPITGPAGNVEFLLLLRTA